MSATVVDSSAIAAIAFGEEAAATVLPLLENRALVAPALLPFEVAGVCALKMRSHPDRAALLHGQCVAALAGLDVEIAPVAFEELPLLAAKHGLETQDAAYLWLALAHDLPLVTLDERLSEAYRRLKREKGRSDGR